jgi:hypothetical protein
MGQEVRAGRPLRGSQVWAARNTRDAETGVGLAQMDISATPVLRPGPPDRRALMVETVYHHMITQARWIPPVQVSAIRQSHLPPMVHRRN